MCLTMFDPATSWFEIVDLPKLRRETSGSKVTTNYWNVVMQVIPRTTEIDMADSVNPVSLMSFYQTTHVALHSTYHTVLKSLTRYSNN